MRDRIGTFDSTTLAGEPLTVPGGLAGLTLVCVAYRQWQQRDVDGWLAAVAGDDRVEVLEVPVLGRRWLPGRRFIDGGMAANMDATTRARTMCVYTDVAGFRRDVLGVDSDAVCAVLTDPSGAVHWSALGPTTPADVADLRAVIRERAGPADG